MSIQPPAATPLVEPCPRRIVFASPSVHDDSGGIAKWYLYPFNVTHAAAPGQPVSITASTFTKSTLTQFIENVTH